jgi:hypothetical protein
MMPSPTKTATMIRMILSALPPELGGAPAGGAYGWEYGTGAGAAYPVAAAAVGAPHAVQNCVSEDTAAPHFVQKLATVVSLSFQTLSGIGNFLFCDSSKYTSSCVDPVRILH